VVVTATAPTPAAFMKFLREYSISSLLTAPAPLFSIGSQMTGGEKQCSAKK
jgi:hypothetical protein